MPNTSTTAVTTAKKRQTTKTVSTTKPKATTREVKTEHIEITAKPQTTAQTDITTAAQTEAAPATISETTTEYILITDPQNETSYADTQQMTAATVSETPPAIAGSEENPSPSPVAILTFIIVLVGAIVAGVTYFFFKRKEVSPGGSKEKTAQQLINVSDIDNKFLYTQDDKAFVYLKINGLPIDLYTNEELMEKARFLSARLIQIKFEWKFISATRPMNLKPILNIYKDLQNNSTSEARRKLLELEENELMSIANAGGATERQHYAVIWGDKTKSAQVLKNAEQLLEIFAESRIETEILETNEIVELLNVINIPTYTRLENRYDFDDELLQAILKE